MKAFITLIFLLLPVPLYAKCNSLPVSHHAFSYQEIVGDTLKVYFQPKIDGLTFKGGGVSFETFDGKKGQNKVMHNSALVLWRFKLKDKYKSINVFANYDDKTCSRIDIKQNYQDEIASLDLKVIQLLWHETPCLAKNCK